MSALVEPHSFAHEGTAAVHRLRRAVVDLITSVGADPVKPQDLARRFKLDKTLTWHLSRLVREEDAWEAVGHIPGRPSIQTLIDRLESGGASAQSADAVRLAMDQFETFINRHSGDRETLEIMIGVGDRPSAAKRQEGFRKQGFLANSAAWGIQARVHFSCSIMLPSTNPHHIDMATLAGLTDIRRLRPNVPWAVSSANGWTEDTRSEIAVRPEPLWPDGLIDGVPILPNFCSQPLPNLAVKATPGGSCRFEITGGPVGCTAASTVVMGWKWARSASIFGDAPTDVGEHGVHLSTPVELMIKDLVVHKSFHFAMHPTAAVYSNLPGGPTYPHDGPDHGRMPISEDVTNLGAQPPNMTALEFPRYQELVEFALARLGWSLNEFHAFRYRVKYPTIPTIAVLRHPLLVRPSSGSSGRAKGADE